MPPRPTTHCCRGLQHKLASSREGIWVTDKLLASAFERYCLVSSRKASNVPGPLESRRRLGKRQIGDLNVAHSTPSLPPWAIQNSPDLSQWNWEPPTPLTARQNEASRAAVSERLLPSWLTEWTPTTPEETTEPPSRAFCSEETQATSVLEELGLFAKSLLNSPVDSVDQRFKDICRRFETDLSLGQIPNEGLLHAVENVLEAIAVRSEHLPKTSKLVPTLYSAITTGIANSRVLRPSDLGLSFWSALLTGIIKLPASGELCDVFGLVMGALPIEYHGSLSKEILHVLETVLRSWVRPDEWDPSAAASHFRAATESYQLCQDLLTDAAASLTRDVKLASTVYQRAREAHQQCHDVLDLAAESMSAQARQTRVLSRALSRMDPKRPALVAANRLAHSLSSQLPPHAQRQLRYNWLSALAQSPLISQKILVEMCGSFLVDQPPVRSALTHVEACQLLISHWRSRGRLTHPQRFESLFKNLGRGSQNASLAALAYAVFLEEKERKWLIDSLCRFSRATGRLHDLPESFASLSETRDQIPVQLFERVATAVDNHQVAVRLREAYIMHFSGSEEQLHWDPNVWRKYLDDIFKDPAISPAKMWEILGIEFYEDMSRANRSVRRRAGRAYGRHGRRSAQIAADLALRFAYADHHLGDRVAYRHVSQCVRFLEKHTGNVPPRVLQALYHVVSRDLAQGRPGRTARLLWFLRVVKRNSTSDQVPEECAQLLQQWRRLTRCTRPGWAAI